MIVEITIFDHPIDPRAPLPPEIVGRAGAVAEFTGLIRAEENGRLIGALDYEAYQPMAEHTMRALAEDLGARHPCLFLRVVHRIGTVPVGEAAIHIIAASAHRAAALGLVADFMDRLKQDVPIWKIRALAPNRQPLPAAP